MHTIIFFGDSGQLNSALKAYRKAYHHAVDEIYCLISENARIFLDTQYQIAIHKLKRPVIERIFTYQDSNIIHHIKKMTEISNYYYESSNNTDSRNYRCFIAASMTEAVIENLSHQLGDILYQQYIAVSTNSANEHYYTPIPTGQSVDNI